MCGEDRRRVYLRGKKKIRYRGGMGYSGGKVRVRREEEKILR